MTEIDFITLPQIKKSIEIDIVSKLRGFAAMAVFLFHIVCVTNGYISNKLLNQIFSYGKYGVQFFFVISGFVITYSMLKGNYTIKDFFIFLKKRIIRIEPPYLAVVVITFIFLVVRNVFELGNGYNEIPGIAQILLHIGYLIPFSDYNWISIVFWTLAIEFQFYFIFSFVFPFYMENRWIRGSVQILLLCLFYFYRSESFFFHWSPIFILGINLALFKLRRTKLFELVLTSLVMSVVIFYQLGWAIFISSIIPFILIYVEPKIKSKLWEFFGKISYSLYLSHTLVAFAIINLGIQFTHHFYQKIFFVTLAFGLTILFSYLLYHFIEKPFKLFASSIKYST